MRALASATGVHLLTNLETTWYPSVHAARALVQEGAIGEVRKVVVHDGHGGRRRSGGAGVPPWLSDPWQRRGSAHRLRVLRANLVTWLLQGEEPLTVTAVTSK